MSLLTGGSISSTVNTDLRNKIDSLQNYIDTVQDKIDTLAPLVDATKLQLDAYEPLINETEPIVRGVIADGNDYMNPITTRMRIYTTPYYYSVLGSSLSRILAVGMLYDKHSENSTLFITYDFSLETRFIQPTNQITFSIYEQRTGTSSPLKIYKYENIESEWAYTRMFLSWETNTTLMNPLFNLSVQIAETTTGNILFGDANVRIIEKRNI